MQVSRIVVAVAAQFMKRSLPPEPSFVENLKIGTEAEKMAVILWGSPNGPRIF